eukprot:Gregarina_sp_Pseudo_9__493@NODE_1313_length_1694_cov_60_141994_g1234_i0_p1_GENE_NODE_1313_length_1694_cov_60_141994_g1234_i0NODE_1313_length_1694_cov_60_141994_g1234_i0_p1_ORF_typecomplete_len495_score167_56Peptidase_M18/PF02127_15/1e128Peptidase_M42/PF05343_14/0_32_NODE_1313_length_1694_cov_60_141994_g1234_i02081623
MVAGNLVNFLNACGSPYHAVDAVINSVLKGALAETRPGGVSSETARLSGYMRRDGAVIAWRAAPDVTQTPPSLVLLASHTDCPCLRLRPHSKLEAENCDMLGVETYGGGLWRTWLDRGLSLAGKVVLRAPETGELRSKLVRLSKPVAYIPSLCIHLMTQEERAAFKLNNEDQLRPIIGITKKPATPAADKAKEEGEKVSAPPSGCRQEELTFAPRILDVVAKELGVSTEEIVSWDLCLYDSAPAGVVGVDAEFIDGGGLDNRSSLFCNFTSLMEAPEPTQGRVYVAVGFDHEEIGSQSTVGADSCLLQNWLLDILELCGVSPATAPSVLRRAVRSSLLLSCDAAHAVHPNYASKHQAAHKPLIGAGVVVKSNANQRYATTAFGTGFVRSLSGLSGTDKYQPLAFQEFEVRNDSGCGSTIGPMASSLSGIETIDLGMPIWAMHAVREVASPIDAESLINLGLLAYQKWQPEK